MKKIEILAPVGGMAHLKAAVFSGADAVYLGYSRFSARESAMNFSREELIEAVKFCHERSVKVFVAINTLIKNDEMSDIVETLEFLCEIAVDALIVQDMGLFYIARKACPNMAVHCSTQMSIMSSSAVKLMQELGAKRAVLAREMTLKEIEFVKKNSDIELEVFVHGALCMCISGQCYFSAMLGSRSGNRGRCAQTCRLPFKAKNGNGFDLSLKDLSYIENIEKLANIGVSSAKIEGRMKRPEYVAAAVSCAKDVLENEVPNEVLKANLHNVFSRSGFTKGYLDDKIDENMFGIRTKEDVQKGNSDVFASLHSLYKNEIQKIALKLEVSIFVGEIPSLTAIDENGNTVTVQAEKQAEQAINKPLLADDIKTRISKFGGTPFFVKDINVKTDEQSSVPASVLNSLRRTATEKLMELSSNKKAIECHFQDEAFEHRESTSLQYRAEFSDLSQVPENTDVFEYIYLPLEAPLEHFEKLKNRKSKLGAVMPSAVFGNDDKIYQKAKLLCKNGINTFVCPNLYAVQIARELDAEIHGAFSLNVINNYAVKQFEDLGVESLELSYEISKVELENIRCKAKRGTMLYGRQTLMIVRNCPQRKTANACATCSGSEVLVDRLGTSFPVMCSKYRLGNNKVTTLSQYSKILNSTALFMFDREREVKNVDFGVLRFTVENNVEICRIIESIETKKNPENTLTRGLFYRAVL